jgi:hypothetical protein
MTRLTTMYFSLKKTTIRSAFFISKF